MFSRLIFKSVLVICTVAMLMGSIARAESLRELSFDQIQDLPSETFKLLSSRDYTDTDKLDLIQQRRFEVESSIRRLLLDGQASPSDLNRSSSDLSKAMKVAEKFVILAQLEVSSGQFTENSCIEAKGMLNISAMEPEAQGGEVDMDRQQSKVSKLLKVLCR